MKTAIKISAFAAMMMAFAVVPASAQDECQTLADKYTANYKSSLPLAQRKIAVEAGEQYLAKCNTEANADQVKYFNERVPKLKDAVQREEAFGGFNDSLKTAKSVNDVKVDDAFKYGKMVLVIEPDMIDVPIVLASIGFDKAIANPPVDTYNNDAVNYSKMAIQKIEAGKTSEQYGAYIYSFKNPKYPDTKSNALAWLNYYIGYIMAERQNNIQGALPYYYKAIQLNSAVKTRPGIYQTIGANYLKEYNRIDDERTKLVEQAKSETNEETKKQLIDKAKEMLLLQKGYADRIIDAYARAYSNAGTDKAYKDSLYNVLKGAYNFRYDGNVSGLNDNFISQTAAKPLPDPASPVTPVVDTTATTTSSTTTPTSSTITTPTTKPATTGATTTNGTGTKTNVTTGTTTKPATTTPTKTAPTKTTPAKTPVPKKKGTR